RVPYSSLSCSSVRWVLVTPAVRESYRGTNPLRLTIAPGGGVVCLRVGHHRWEGPSMGRVMLESALGRRSVRTVLAGGLIPATLLLFGLGDSGTPSSAAIESEKPGPRQEERPLTRQGHGAAVVNGRIYVIGGAGEDSRPFGSVQVYDPATGTWTARANMPTSRGLFGTGVVGGAVYALGGGRRGGGASPGRWGGGTPAGARGRRGEVRRPLPT